MFSQALLRSIDANKSRRDDLKCDPICCLEIPNRLLLSWYAESRNIKISIVSLLNRDGIRCDDLSKGVIKPFCFKEASGLESWPAPIILKCPKNSEIARKRKVLLNPPPKGKRRSRGHGTFDPKSVTPMQRVKEFSDENLCVSNKKLFCIMMCYYVVDYKNF
jgi:hypothetical protein